MAAGPSLPVLLEEATCSICLDYFQDPVLIPECSHNFCRGCLTRSWGTSESKASSCPQCRQTFARHPEEEGGSFCPKHREPLKLFCKDHETLICVVCDRSKEHSCHWVIPAEEAFQEYQVGISHCGGASRSLAFLSILRSLYLDTEQTAQEMLDLIENVKKKLVAEFRELHLWLEGQEKLLLTKMEETEKDIMARKEKGLAKHMEEVRSLDHLIHEIEEKLQQPASKLLQVRTGSGDHRILGLEGTLEALYCCSVQFFSHTRPAAEALFSLPSFLPFPLTVHVTLDPDTTIYGSYKISKDGKRIKGLQGVIYNPTLFGSQLFSSGRHFWDVIVDGSRGWAVGVTNKPVRLENVHVVCRQWHIWVFNEKYRAMSPSGYSDLVLTERPTKIRVCVNCEGGQVSLFDAKTATLLHTFLDASLVGETLRPHFSVGHGICVTLL
uniref:Uncharacterized protein n=1 Tax=Naja naja TaxID=35670 RepID=A0A8C6V6R2_NAJNA